MHKDIVTHGKNLLLLIYLVLCSSKNDFIITASNDGQVKF